MRQRKPNCPQLQEAGSSRIEYAARNVDMGHCIAEQKNVAAMHADQQGEDRKASRKDHDDECLAIPAPLGYIGHSRWVSSRNTWKRASISALVKFCNRSVPKRSTANDPITPP